MPVAVAGCDLEPGLGEELIEPDGIQEPQARAVHAQYRPAWPGCRLREGDHIAGDGLNFMRPLFLVRQHQYCACGLRSRVSVCLPSSEMASHRGTMTGRTPEWRDHDTRRRAGAGHQTGFAYGRPADGACDDEG